jgi:RNA polymerase sigma-70 factor (ECF subfamily)
VYGLPSRDPAGRLSRVTDEGSRDVAARLKDGDESALRELFQREEKRALALAYRVVGDMATAEDAVQEAFAQLWERASQLDPDGGRIESLLMTIVHRRAIDLVRRAGRQSAQLPDAELLEPIDEQATAMLDRVEETLSTAKLRTELRAAVESLPADQRAILNHVYFGHRSLREAAELEGLPLGTAKSRLRLAMAKLGTALRNRNE